MNLFFVLILLIASVCNGAELLVKAKPQWMESVDRSNFTDKQLKQYERRYRVGDVVVIKPDNWKWGKRECL